MAVNWNLLLIMLGYAMFNGIGSLFYKLGLKKVEDTELSFLSFSKKSLKLFYRLLKNPIWLLGLVCLVIDFIIYQNALKIYDISLVKPLVNLNLIFVVLFGITIIKERILIREWIGLAFILSGGFMITSNSVESETVLNIPRFWIFFGASTVIVILILVLFRKYPPRAFYLGGFCGLLYGLGSLFNKALYASGMNGWYQALFLGLFGVTYFLAFLSGQQAYLVGRMSIVSTLVNIVSIVIPFLGGVFLFDEPLLIPGVTGVEQFLKLIGLGCIIIGISLNYTPVDGVPNSIDSNQGEKLEIII
ncbi:MAG: EamA family transporter [Promethearchaeota archaeon]